MTAKSKKFLESVPGFLDVIEKIAAQGFFDSQETNIKSSVFDKRDRISQIIIKGNGYIPDNKKDLRTGIVSLVDTVATVEKIRQLLEESKSDIKSHFFKTETKPWLKYDRAEENVTGTLGMRIEYFLSIELQ